MNKCILFTLAMSFISFSSLAENEAAYNLETGLLHIPKIIVDGKEYKVNLVHQGNLNFSVTQADLISAYPDIVGSWQIPSGGVLTFWPNGSYHVFDYEDGEGCFTGLETGTYEYTPVRDGHVVHDIQVTGVNRDENGDCGLACNGDPCPPSQLWVENNTLYVRDRRILQFPKLQ